MALAQTLRDAVDTAFAAIEDIAIDITYVKVTVGAYDVVTDEQSLTTVNVACQAVMYNGRDMEQDSVWRLTSAQAKHSHSDDTRVLIPASTLGAYKPKTEDYLMIDGAKWEIYNILPVPSNPCWILQVRLP